MSSSGGKGGKGGGARKRQKGSSFSVPAAKSQKTGKGGKGGKGNNLRLLEVVYKSVLEHRACLKFVQGQSCTDCGYSHFCYWAEGSNVHWSMRNDGDVPTAEQINSIRLHPNDRTNYVLDEFETKTGQTSAQVASAPANVIVIADEESEDKKSGNETSILKPYLRHNEWESKKRGLEFQIAGLQHRLTAPDLTETGKLGIEKKIAQFNERLREGERRCAARDDADDGRCGRADEGLPECTANEFRYVLVPAKFWEAYDPADDESIPGVADQGAVLDTHTKEQVHSMTWLFYQLVQGLARPEGDSRKKGQFIPPPSCSFCATGLDYVTRGGISAFNSGVPRGQEYPNPCFRCLCVWYCSASCKYAHRHHHALACHRHPAYFTATELHAKNTNVSLDGDLPGRSRFRLQ